MSKRFKELLLKLLNNHAQRTPGGAQYYRWFNRETGELQTSLLWCLISSLYDRAAHGCNTLKWARYRSEIYR